MRAVLLVLLVAHPMALAAPAPFPKPQKAPTGPFEIDFSPLEGNVPVVGEWQLSIAIAGKAVRKRVISLIGDGGRPTPKEIVASLVKMRIPASGSIVAIVADASGKKVFLTPRPGLQELAIRIYLEGVNKSFIPSVRRLPK